MTGMAAIFAPRDRVTGKAAGDATNNRAHHAVGSQATNQRAAASAQSGTGIMRMTAAIIRRSGDRARAECDNTGRSNLCKALHLILLGLSGRKHETKTAAARNRSKSDMIWKDGGNQTGSTARTG